MVLTTLEEQCRDRIIDLVPMIRQVNAALFAEHEEYVKVTLTILKNRFYELEAEGANEWTDPPADIMQWINDNRPYNI